MNQEKYIGMDVHQATVSVAVMDAHSSDGGWMKLNGAECANVSAQ
jgi:hypothetical protein